MIQKEKQLLLKDLCARLLYRPKGVKLNTFFDPEDITVIGYTGRFVETVDDEIEVEQVRLYLRPMSSMTEEEREEFRMLILPEASCAYEDCLEWDAQIIGGGYLQISVKDFSTVTDWLNAHHFDYRGLIQMGLALEAKESMYKTE